MSYKTAFVSCIESDSCIIAFLKVLSKTSKGVTWTSKGHLQQAKRALIGSQFTPFLFSVLEFYLQNPTLFTKAIESLKGRRMRKSIILLFPYLNQIQLLFLGLRCLLFHQPTSNLLTCLLVILSTKETFFCYSVFIFRPSFVSLLLCLYLSCLNLTLSQSGLVILSTAKAVIIIMNYEF